MIVLITRDRWLPSSGFILKKPAGLAEQARQLAREALAEVAGFLHRCGASVLSVKSVGNLVESGRNVQKFLVSFVSCWKKSLFQEISSGFFYWRRHLFYELSSIFVFFWEGVAGVEISDVKELTPQNSAEWIFVFSPYIYSLSLYIIIYIMNNWMELKVLWEFQSLNAWPCAFCEVVGILPWPGLCRRVETQQPG